MASFRCSDNSVFALFMTSYVDAPVAFPLHLPFALFLPSLLASFFLYLSSLSFSSLFFSSLLSISLFMPMPSALVIAMSISLSVSFLLLFPSLFCYHSLLSFCLPSLFKQRRKYLCDLARFMNSETVCWGQPRSLFQWEQTPIPPCGIVSDKELREYFRRCRFPP